MIVALGCGTVAPEVEEEGFEAVVEHYHISIQYNGRKMRNYLDYRRHKLRVQSSRERDAFASRVDHMHGC
jgi:hypothetical protein